MTINGNRRFRGNDGHTYLVQNAPACEVYKGKYILTRDVGGFWRLCHDSLLDVLHFASIKDAQRYVLYNADCIELF